MKDKFRLFKSKRFQVAMRHNLSYEHVIEKPLPFTMPFICGCCMDDYEAGWYKGLFFFGYIKLEDL